MESQRVGQVWPTFTHEGFPGGSDGKESACNVGDLGSIPGWGRPPGEGNGNPFQYSWLGNPIHSGAWQAPVHGVVKSWTQLRDFTFTFTCCPFTIYLAVSDLSCHMRDLHVSRGLFRWLPLSMWDLGSLNSDWTCILCIATQILNHWTTRGASIFSLSWKCILKHNSFKIWNPSIYLPLVACAFGGMSKKLSMNSRFWRLTPIFYLKM